VRSGMLVAILIMIPLSLSLGRVVVHASVILDGGRLANELRMRQQGRRLRIRHRSIRTVNHYATPILAGIFQPPLENGLVFHSVRDIHLICKTHRNEACLQRYPTHLWLSPLYAHDYKTSSRRHPTAFENATRESSVRGTPAHGVPDVN